MKLSLTINGSTENLEVSPLTRLLDLLREHLGLTGTKEGCGEGECGACSVLLNGHLVNSCLIPAGQLEGADIMTIDGYRLTDGGRILIDSFTRQHSAQCGFCTPGMVLAAASLLKQNSSPDESQIRLGLSGNICRCTGYDMIIDGIQLAAETAKKEGVVW